MKNFDTFIGIDWSGAKAPIHTKSIAVAMVGQGSDAPILEEEPWSRSKVFEYIQGIKRRTLIGIDANFGYAQKIGEAQFGSSYDYNDLWAAVEAKSAHQDNFFAGGYWEHYPQYFWTHGKRPAHITLPKRATEIACSAAGYGNPESPFKLLGPKQVGKGGLSAMRMAYALKREMGDQICIWPFEREIADTARIVLTEIYPRQFLMRTGHGVAKVQTLDELNTLLKALESQPYMSSCGSTAGSRDEQKDPVVKPQDDDIEVNFSDHDADAIVSAAGLRYLCGREESIPHNVAYPKPLSEKAAKREGWIFGI